MTAIDGSRPLFISSRTAEKIGRAGLLFQQREQVGPESVERCRTDGPRGAGVSSASHAPQRTRAPRLRASAKRSTSAVFPIPASPPTSTRRPLPRGGDGAEETVQFIDEVFALEQFHSLPETGTSFELAGRRQETMMLLKMRSRREGLRKEALRRRWGIASPRGSSDKCPAGGAGLKCRS